MHAVGVYSRVKSGFRFHASWTSIGQIHIATYVDLFLRPAFLRNLFRRQLGEAAVTFLESRLIASEPLTQEIKLLIEKLDAPEFHVREAATRKLVEHSLFAVPALQKASQQSDSAEVRARAATILSQIAERSIEPSAMQMIRAVQVLERISSENAINVLKALAKGPAS